MIAELIARLRRQKNRTLILSDVQWRHEAMALMDAAAAALEAQSVPPREPTPEMLRIGDDVFAYSERDGKAAIGEAWRAMYDAAPKVEPQDARDAER